MSHNMSQKSKYGIIILFAFFSALVLAVVSFMSIKASTETRYLLEQSIKSTLMSICSTAEQIIDPALFDSINSEKDARSNPAYARTLYELCALAESADVDYIYALKKQDGEAVFVFDTDSVNNEIFIPYELSEVHTNAFAGHGGAEVMNVQDEWGTYNTGAIPLRLDGRIIGIVSADIRDTLLERNLYETTVNTIILIASVTTILTVMIITLANMLRRIREMQAKLSEMALRDRLTGLPNRQYLFDRLTEITSARKKVPFALYFIDLDNFKQVNDNVGHDAGDELLRRFGEFLEQSNTHSETFRPSAGMLNVAARVGGDEFIMLLPGVDSGEKAAGFAASLIEGFMQRDVDKYVTRFGVGLSVGIALYPEDTEDFNVLIKYADLAMYHSKRHGKNQYMLYNDSLAPKNEK